MHARAPIPGILSLSHIILSLALFSLFVAAHFASAVNLRLPAPAPAPAPATSFPDLLPPTSPAPVPAPVYLLLENANATIPQLALETMPPRARRDLPWAVQKEYSGPTFFNDFEFFSQDDPSNGLVNYVDRNTAFSQGLAFWTQAGVPGIQAEHWATIPAGGKRNSVRITSRDVFGGGLFVFDIAVLPWGWGVWPAVWLLGYAKSWPSGGEIDVVEGVHVSNKNQMTATAGCTIAQDGSFTGALTDGNCDSSAGGSGCGIVSDSTTSYGPGFNNFGGGVFALLWDGNGMKIWNWGREAVPSDITAGNPSPVNWGQPVGAWSRVNCDPYTYFAPATIILNINLCGDWAGNTYSTPSGNPGDTCAEHIANPANLGQTVMLINSIKVYQQTASVSMASDISNLTGAGGHVAQSVQPFWHSGAGRRLPLPLLRGHLVSVSVAAAVGVALGLALA